MTRLRRALRPSAADRPRRAGVLLHPTALPGPWGVGDLGPAAHRFCDWLARAGQSTWQMLPLGPPAGGGAPYTALSTAAGDPLLLSPEGLVESGFLDARDLADASTGLRLQEGRIDFRTVGRFKHRLARRAFARFEARGALDPDRARFSAYRRREATWLAEWTLFAALRESFADRAWIDWPAPLRDRVPDALAAARREHAESIAFHAFVQWRFDAQWRRLREEAAARGIEIIGDLPIYPAHDSDDVWRDRALFDLDADGRPRAVSGVPPDAFSADGQLWGHPLYRWEAIARDGYRLWIRRLGDALFRAEERRLDRVRVDHFRGFLAAWAVPAGAETAAAGAWRPGPGRPLFEALAAGLASRLEPGESLPIVAEDLGIITEAVHALRRAVGVPGMAVLQFGFEGTPSVHSPGLQPRDVVVYTGTHDNDTSRGWFERLDAESRERFAAHALPGEAASRTLIRLAHASTAELAMVPLQDVLDLPSSARTNTPGTVSDDRDPAGNWRWRVGAAALDDAAAERLRASTREHGRLAGEPSEARPPHC